MDCSCSGRLVRAGLLLGSRYCFGLQGAPLQAEAAVASIAGLHVSASLQNGGQTLSCMGSIARVTEYLCARLGIFKGHLMPRRYRQSPPGMFNAVGAPNEDVGWPSTGSTRLFGATYARRSWTNVSLLMPMAWRNCDLTWECPSNTLGRDQQAMPDRDLALRSGRVSRRPFRTTSRCSSTSTTTLPDNNQDTNGSLDLLARWRRCVGINTCPGMQPGDYCSCHGRPN